LLIAGTSFAQSPEPEDLNALYKEFVTRREMFESDIHTLGSKVKGLLDYFDKSVEKIEYSESTGNFNLVTPKLSPEERTIFDSYIETKDKEIYKDFRYLAEELPKLQAMNSRLIKGGVPIAFDEKCYNGITTEIIRHTSDN
jgi:hypothetical protein